MIKKKLPKSISNRRGKYAVAIYSKIQKKSIHVGVFEDLPTAVKNRDIFVCNNYDKIGNYLPRGINKTVSGKYEAILSLEGINHYIGRFKTLQLAVDARREVILSLL